MSSLKGCFTVIRKWGGIFLLSAVMSFCASNYVIFNRLMPIAKEIWRWDYILFSMLAFLIAGLFLSWLTEWMKLRENKGF